MAPNASSAAAPPGERSEQSKGPGSSSGAQRAKLQAELPSDGFEMAARMEGEVVHRLLGLVKEIKDWKAEKRTTGQQDPQTTGDRLW